MKQCALNDESPHTSAKLRPVSDHPKIIADLTDFQHVAVLNQPLRNLRAFSQPTTTPRLKVQLCVDTSVSFEQNRDNTRKYAPKPVKLQHAQYTYWNTMTLPLVSDNRGHIASTRLPSSSMTSMD